MLNDPPGAIVPEFHAPLLATELCATESLFVQVTVPPTATVTGFGAYAVVVSVDDPDTIDTGVQVVVVGAVVEGEDEEPHAAANIDRRIKSA